MTFKLDKELTFKNSGKKTYVVQESRIHIFTVVAKDVTEARELATELDYCSEDNWTDTELEVLQEVKRKK